MFVLFMDIFQVSIGIAPNAIKKLDIKEIVNMNEKIEKKRTECEVYSRVVGYLRPVGQWNRGKQQEFSDRKTFDPNPKQVIEVCE